MGAGAVSKQSGLGDQLFVDGYDIGGDVQSISSLSTPIATLEMTGITKSAFERDFGIANAQGEFTSFFNDADDAAHEALKTLPRADGHLMYLRGSGQGNQAIGMVGKRIDYAGSRGDDGSFTFGVSMQGSGNVADWCTQLTDGKTTVVAAGDQAGVVLGGGGSKSFGWQAYLQVFSFTGTSADIKLQTSSDDGAVDAYADLTDGAFTTVTGRTAERIASSSDTATVEQWVRVNVAGTFSNLVFAVIINRNNATRYVS
jgi:hypothetical protein